jgi:hypothetical protein
MHRIFHAFAVVLLFATAACSDSNLVDSSQDDQADFQSGPSAFEPGFLAQDGIAVLAPNTLRTAHSKTTRADKAQVCHFPSRGEKPSRPLTVSGNNLSAHLDNHSKDGLVGDGYADPANRVLYNSQCDPLPERPVCPCWAEAQTRQNLADHDWTQKGQKTSVIKLTAPGGMMALATNTDKTRRCVLKTGSEDFSINDVPQDQINQCQVDLLNHFRN